MNLTGRIEYHVCNTIFRKKILIRGLNHLKQEKWIHFSDGRLRYWIYLSPDKWTELPNHS